MKEKTFKQRIDDFFGISKNGSSFKVEIIAGIATFLAMSYILVVNPNQILYDGASDFRWPSLFIATAFGAIIGTLLMALYAKMPLGQASGMGLNSAVGGVIGGGVGGAAYVYGYEYSLSNALLLVLISGVVFLLFSVIPIGKDKKTGELLTLREKIYDGMPKCLTKAIPVGIGFFIAFIGLQNAKIVSGNKYTLLEFVDFTKIFTEGLYDAEGNVNAFAYALVGFVSFFSIAIFDRFQVKGSVIFGVLIGTIIAVPLGVTDIAILLGNAEESGVTWKFWENLGAYFSNDGLFFSVFKDGFDMPKGSLFTSVMLIITFCMLDMFDTMGTVLGCSVNAGLVDENGKPLNYNKIMLSDSVATVAGSFFGTSTVTTFVESGTGIAAGGRTGFTALVTAILFTLSIFLLPLFAFIPSAAAAGALIYVGVLMMKNTVNIDLSSTRTACTSFLTILLMVLTYSITKGIGIGVIAYVLITVVSNCLYGIKYLISKKPEDKPEWDISLVLWVVFILFLVYFLVPTVL